MKKVIMLLFLTISVLSASVAENLQLFQSGKKAFSVGLYAIAQENFELYLSEEYADKRSDALYLCGISGFYLKKYGEAISYLEAIEKEFPESAYIDPSYYWIGLSYYYKNDYNNSVIWLSKNIDLNSKFSDISLLYRALSNVQLNDYIRAEESFLLVLNRDDSRGRYKEEALYRLSTLYLEQIKYNEAINMLNRLIFDFPDSKYYIDCLSLLSDSYFLLEEWSSALRSYELLREFRPTESKVYKRLATIQYYLSDFKGAKEALYYYDNNYGSDKEVLFMLGDILLQQNEINDAIEVYEKIESISSLNDKERIENDFRMGKLYYRLEQYSPAYNKFVKLSDKESIYLAFLSGLKADKEVLSLIKLLNNQYLGSDYAYDTVNRYINYLDKIGKVNELEQFLFYATTIYPENIKYSLTYGELLLENNRLDESLKYLAKGYNSDSGYYSNLSYKIGWIYYHKEQYTRSIEYFERLEEGDEDYIKALYSKSIAQYKIGELVKGRDGFLKLLETQSPYNRQVSFYLGLIEKDNYKYEEALNYFITAKEDEILYNESINNIAWCYYHLKNYEKALNIYLETDNKFNAANCYLYMEQYEEALALYLEVIEADVELESSAYYKSIEILFTLTRDEEAFTLTERYKKAYPTSDLPGEVLLTNSDNLLYGDRVDDAIISFNKVMELFSSGKEWTKARFRLGECYYIKEEYDTALSYYLDSIIAWDNYTNQSLERVVSILSEQSNPVLTLGVKENIDKNIEEKDRVIPIYIEYIRQSITSDNILKEIDNSISISSSRNEINELIYLKALYFYSDSNIEESQNSLKLLLSRPEVSDNSKIDAIMLQAKILSDTNEISEAIDLYLKLYINFSDNLERASHALYNGLLLTRFSGDVGMEEKIYNILLNEFADTDWGQRGLNE